MTARIAVPVLVAALALAGAAGTRFDARAFAAAADTSGAPNVLPADSAFTTIFLMRHAEKSLVHVGSDPPLTEAGERRAEGVARTLGDAEITAIYSTHYRRCRDTAMPLARLIGDTLRIVDQGDFAGFARRIVGENPGGRVLVVGHSDTVPQILAALAGLPAASFPGSDHDALHVVTVPRQGQARVMRLRIGDAPASPGH